MHLHGVRVLALENGLAGPLCSRLLADFGADVIKVERPGVGDVTRAWDSGVAGLSSGFVWMNRGKRSIELDVKDPASRPALERLIERSDVLLQNFTPGWTDRVGLDEPTVRALRGDIVYTSISGYGPEGPYAHRNAYDLVMQGETGLMSLGGTPEEPSRIAISVCDLSTGVYGALGTLAALLRRAGTGEGEHVEVSMFDVSLDWLGYFPLLWWHGGKEPERTGMRHPLFCPYGPFPAGDGRLVDFAVLSEGHWRALCLDVLERPDLYEDGRYRTNKDRVGVRAELEPRLEEAFASRPAAEWLARLEAARIPCGAVRTLAEAMEHPQLAHNQLEVELGSPSGPLRAIASAFVLGGRRPDLGPVPALGEHTDEILAELGLEAPD